MVNVSWEKTRMIKVTVPIPDNFPTADAQGNVLQRRRAGTIAERDVYKLDSLRKPVEMHASRIGFPSQAKQFEDPARRPKCLLEGVVDSTHSPHAVIKLD